MGTVARRLVTACALCGGMLADGMASVLAAAQSSDPAYVILCVPSYAEVGDLDCEYFYDQGIYGIVLADPYNDPHRLDGWNYVDDRYGCEG